MYVRFLCGLHVFLGCHVDRVRGPPAGTDEKSQ